MSIFYRIFIVLLVIGALYSLIGIFHFKRMYHKVENPRAEFQVLQNPDAPLTLVEFTGYYCGYCKELQPVIDELLTIRKDIRHVTRPIVFTLYEEHEHEHEHENDEHERTASEDTLTPQIFAAGLQDKFEIMHKAMLEFPAGEQMPEDFIEQTGMLYGVDYEQLQKDANGKEVKKIIDDNQNSFSGAGLNSVPSFMMNNQILVISEENLPTFETLLNFVTTAEKQ